MTPEQFLECLDKRIAECQSALVWIEAKSIKYYTIQTEIWTLERVKKDFLTLTPPSTTLS